MRTLLRLATEGCLVVAMVVFAAALRAALADVIRSQAGRPFIPQQP